MDKFKPTEVQKIILEILVEDPKKAWNQHDLIIEALKRERRINQIRKKTVEVNRKHRPKFQWPLKHKDYGDESLK